MLSTCEFPANPRRRLVLRERGFTLVELMTAIAVMAILAAIAVPSFNTFINDSRLASQANELIGTLQYARSEAIRRNRKVTVCPSSNGSSCLTSTTWTRWIARIDNSGEVLRDFSGKAGITATGDVSAIVYGSDGLAKASTGMLATAQIVVCMDTTRPAENRRLVQLAGGSRLEVKRETGSCP